MITAGLTAVAALAYRYDDDATPVALALTVPPVETATAGQRVVALVEGAAGDVTTAVSTTSGIPMLTLTGTGEALTDAARVLSSDTLGLSGTDAAEPVPAGQAAQHGAHPHPRATWGSTRSPSPGTAPRPSSSSCVRTPSGSRSPP